MWASLKNEAMVSTGFKRLIQGAVLWLNACTHFVTFKRQSSHRTNKSSFTLITRWHPSFFMELVVTGLMDATTASVIVEARQVRLQPQPGLSVIDCSIRQHRWDVQWLAKTGDVIRRMLGHLKLKWVYQHSTVSNIKQRSVKLSQGIFCSFIICSLLAC